MAYDKGTRAVQAIFGSTRKRKGLGYATAVDELAAKDDKTARVAKAAAAAGALLQPGSSAADPYAFRNSPGGPAKPNGFA